MKELERHERTFLRAASRRMVSFEFSQGEDIVKNKETNHVEGLSIALGVYPLLAARKPCARRLLIGHAS